MRSRGNKAKNDKDSIIVDAKNLLRVLYPVVQTMPKIERMENAPREIKRATTDIIRHFAIAKECPEVRMEYIHKMIGDYGVILAMFDILIAEGLLTDSAKLKIARLLERIEEGVKKWRNATRGQLKESGM